MPNIGQRLKQLAKQRANARQVVTVNISFKLVSGPGETIERQSLTEFKSLVKKWLYEDLPEKLAFYAYKDSPEGSYDTDVTPSNLQVTITTK